MPHKGHVAQFLTVFAQHSDQGFALGVWYHCRSEGGWRVLAGCGAKNAGQNRRFIPALEKCSRSTVDACAPAGCRGQGALFRAGRSKPPQRGWAAPMITVREVANRSPIRLTALPRGCTIRRGPCSSLLRNRIMSASAAHRYLAPVWRCSPTVRRPARARSRLTMRRVGARPDEGKLVRPA